MKISKTLIHNLMTSLACVAVEANGGWPDRDKLLPEEQELVTKYAKETILSILDPWEEIMGEEWEVID